MFKNITEENIKDFFCSTGLHYIDKDDEDVEVSFSKGFTQSHGSKGKKFDCISSDMKSKKIYVCRVWCVIDIGDIDEENFETCIDMLTENNRTFSGAEHPHFLILYKSFACTSVSLEYYKRMITKELVCCDKVIMSYDDFFALKGDLPTNTTIKSKHLH